MCINVHGSILPAYRGASPIQAALLHGEKETGVTIMQMSEGMDEGDMLKIRTIAIEDDETSGTLFEKFAQISWKALIDTLLELEHGGITPLPQDHSRATYCKKIEKEDGLIDWTMPAKEICHKWQAYTPWPGIFTLYEGKRLLLEKVSLFRHREEWSDLVSEAQEQDCHVPRSDGDIGQVIKLEDGQIGVNCGEWILTIQQVKLEWKKSQNIKDFVNGNQKFIWYNFN
jgi:methionyl-tRNA formyltransferase